MMRPLLGDGKVSVDFYGPDHVIGMMVDNALNTRKFDQSGRFRLDLAISEARKAVAKLAAERAAAALPGGPPVAIPGGVVHHDEHVVDEAIKQAFAGTSAAVLMAVGAYVAGNGQVRVATANAAAAAAYAPLALAYAAAVAVAAAPGAVIPPPPPLPALVVLAIPTIEAVARGAYAACIRTGAPADPATDMYDSLGTAHICLMGNDLFQYQAKKEDDWRDRELPDHITGHYDAHAGVELYDTRTGNACLLYTKVSRDSDSLLLPTMEQMQILNATYHGHVHLIIDNHSNNAIVPMGIPQLAHTETLTVLEFDDKKPDECVTFMHEAHARKLIKLSFDIGTSIERDPWIPFYSQPFEMAHAGNIRIKTLPGRVYYTAPGAAPGAAVLNKHLNEVHFKKRETGTQQNRLFPKYNPPVLDEELDPAYPKHEDHWMKRDYSRNNRDIARWFKLCMTFTVPQNPIIDNTHKERRNEDMEREYRSRGVKTMTELADEGYRGLITGENIHLEYLVNH